MVFIKAGPGAKTRPEGSDLCRVPAQGPGALGPNHPQDTPAIYQASSLTQEPVGWLGFWSPRVLVREQSPRLRWGPWDTMMRIRQLLANNPKRLSLQTH